MKKKNGSLLFTQQKRLKKDFLFRVSFILCLFFFPVSNPTIAQNSRDSIVFQTHQLTVEQVFDQIMQDLSYDIFYSENELEVKRIIRLPRLKMGLTEILNFILGKEFKYKINAKTIIIIPAEQSSINQGRKIRGIVKDERGEPLPGVSILIKGTSTGVSTNIKGIFNLILPETNKEAELIFSFIGMEPQTIAADKDFISVTMKISINQMDEVIVHTGYENIEKRKLTSSIITVKMEDLMEPVSNTLDNMLQGKIPGMAILQQSSTVGAAPKIRIRGSSTIIGNREPLWVLDGVVLEDPIPLRPEDLNSMDRVNLIGNAISGINPEDIEQIDILKDASATALYGSKAGNGVIMITTKRGKFGKPSISYNSSMGFTQRPDINKMHLMNSKDRIEVSEEMVKRGLQFNDPDPVGKIGYEGLLLQLFSNKISYMQFKKDVKRLKGQNTDWYRELFRNSFSHNHTLSISGANDVINYYFSVGFSNLRGTTLQEESKRYNISTNLDIKISEKLKAKIGLNASNLKMTRPHSSIDLYKYAYSTSRAIAPFDENGNYNFYDFKTAFEGTPNLVYNIFNELNTSGRSSSNTTLNSRFNLIYNLTSHLKLDGLVSYNISSSKRESWAAEDSYYISAKRRLVYGFPLYKPSEENFAKYCSLPYGGILTSNNNTVSNFMTKLTAYFNKNFGIHNISLLGGTEIRSVHTDGISSVVLGYLPDRGKKHVNTDPKIWTRYGDFLKNSQPVLTDSRKNEMSYFASFSYSYDFRYIFNVNVRGDASNRLGQDKSARFLPIWSLSGRWNIINERFMQNINWIQDLDIHGSYGLQGNVTEAHNPNMIINTDVLDEISQQYISTLYSLPNNKLRWEKTKTLNIGTNISFFKGRLNTSFEYFQKKSKDQLVSTTIESTNGGTSVVLNDGNLKNIGWDFAISTILIKRKNVSWNVNFNTSKIKNKVSSTGEMNTRIVSSYLDGSLVRNGKSLNSFYSYRFAGLNENGTPTFHGIKAIGKDGKILISNREEAITQGLRYSGKREPAFTGGLSSNLRVKNFSLSTAFALQFGSKIRLNNLYEEGKYLPHPRQNMSDEFVHRWRNPGDEKHTNIPRLTDEPAYPKGIFTEKGGRAVMGVNIYDFYNQSDLRVVSGNFARCRNISLRYYFNPKQLNHIFMKSASLSFSVSNPFVIKSKKLKGRDPEQINLGSGSIPPQRHYILSLNLTF